MSGWTRSRGPRQWRPRRESGNQRAVRDRRESVTAATRGAGVQPVHSFSGRAVAHLLEALRGMGVESEALCRAVRLRPAALREPGVRVETAVLLRLFAAAEQRSGDALVGLHAAARIRFGGLASFLIGSQNTVADALAAQDRFQELLLGARAVAIVRRGALTGVTLEAGAPPEAVRHLTEYCVASSCRLLRWLTLQVARATAIHFRHGPAGAIDEYERVFGCAVRFHQRDNGALLDRTALAERLVYADPDLAERFDQLARAAHSPRAAYREAVAAALRAAGLDRLAGRREAIARRLGVSARTLQRRLEDEGTSFAAVLDDTRRDIALALLADPLHSLRAISARVGYGDQFAFNKAFRRWTGRSPSAYRRALRGA